VRPFRSSISHPPLALARPARYHAALMTNPLFPHRHLLGIAGMQPHEISYLLDEAEQWVALNRSLTKHDDRLSGMTQINAFFENSTRTLLSFEIAGKRLGADVVNMHAAQSSVKKGETLIDTAITLNAMKPDVIVIRHGSSGAVALIADKVDCPVLNAGDGRHEHPTQALLDALTIRRRKGAIAGLKIAICGDVLHSRVARSNILALTSLAADVRVIAPPTLMPAAIEEMRVTPFADMDEGLSDCDVVMMLRLQTERMEGGFAPSLREYHALYGLTYERLKRAKPDALVMHPGPMNRGVEIASDVADDVNRSVIAEQVEMGVAVRMACLDVLTRPNRT
jgi:aspartate carbamoyltransferase catalytic subunit